MSKTRIVSFLGLGNPKNPERYRPAQYIMGGRKAAATALVEHALCELYDTSHLVVLGTDRVEQEWISSGLHERLLGRRAHFDRVPNGENPAELREVFRHTLAWLAAEPLADLGEQAPPERILLDVTHGFRVQPVLGSAAVAFQRAEWTRRGREDVPELQIVYGKEPATDGGEAEIWDVSEFLEVSEWSAALDSLMRFGRADDLERLGRRHADRQKQVARATGVPDRELGKYGAGTSLGKAAREFTDDLALGRLRDVLHSSAKKLEESLDRDEVRALEEQLPQLTGALADLRSWLRPLQAPSVHSNEGVHAALELGTRLRNLQRYAELAGVVRETLVTLWAVEHGDAVPEPGTSGCKDARERVEKALSALASAAWKKGQPAATPEPTGAGAQRQTAFAGLFNDVGRARNDLMHSGFNDAPIKAAKLKTQLHLYLDRTRELAGLANSAPAASSTSERRFVNLSNHPISSWSQAQLDAATALGFGSPVEVAGGMPQVEPDADTAAVERMAEELANQVSAMGARGAHVATDFGLTVALVGQLQARGVRCFAATTARDAEESTADGAVTKTSMFRFRRWREYPFVG